MFANASIHTEDDLLDIGFDLMNEEGIVSAKMKIVLSCSSRFGGDIEEFVNKIGYEDGISRTLGQVLRLTKAIMDRFPQVVHLSKSNLIIMADRSD